MSFWTKFVANLLAFIFWVFPPNIRWKIGVFLAWLWWDVLKLRRVTVYRNISIVFPKMSKNDKRILAKKSMQQLCYNFVDLFLMIKTAPSECKNGQVVFHGMDNWNQALSKGKGILGLSLHIGNGDKASAVMALNNMPVQVISKKFKQKFLNELWFGVRERWGVQFIEPHGKETAFKILKGLKKPSAVVFVLDQFMSVPYGIQTKFFGRTTGTAYGLALFAIKTQAPVIPIYCYRDSDRRFHVVFDSPMELVPLPDREKTILAWTNQFNAKLEEIILKYPDQWMWVHRRWKTWG